MTYSPPTHILLRRRTDAVSDEEVAYFERALQAQIRDAAHFHGLPAPGVTFVPPETSLGGEAVAIDLVDDDGEEAAIAHHGWAPGANFAWALVGVKEAPDWTVAASHEALEYLCNLRLDRWVDGPDGGRWAYEIADPVQADSYPMAITMFNHMRVVRLSNYVLPAFFGEQGPGAPTVYDYLNSLPAPFSLSPGGYAVVERDGQRTELGAGARRGNSTSPRATSRGTALLRTPGPRQ